MKKMNMIKKMMFLLAPVMLVGFLATAQNSREKSKQTAAVSKDLKAKYEANGMKWNETEANKVTSSTTNGARACIKNKNIHSAPNHVSKQLFDKLPAERQAYVKNHPEKFILAD
ncbi:MAG: hypothetical protein ACHQNT_07815 [Bacteroidia bacterium]